MTDSIRDVVLCGAEFRSGKLRQAVMADRGVVHISQSSQIALVRGEMGLIITGINKRGLRELGYPHWCKGLDPDLSKIVSAIFLQSMENDMRYHPAIDETDFLDLIASRITASRGVAVRAFQHDIDAQLARDYAVYFSPVIILSKNNSQIRDIVRKDAK